MIRLKKGYEPSCPLCRFLEQIAQNSPQWPTPVLTFLLAYHVCIGCGVSMFDCPHPNVVFAAVGTDRELPLAKLVKRSEKVEKRQLICTSTSHLQDAGLILPMHQDAVHTRLQGQQIDANSINLGAVSRWLATCKRLHPQCSQPCASAGAYPRWLFDCHDRRLVRNYGIVDYTALSYVWGPALSASCPGGSHEPNDDLASLPQVVEDAITITKALEFRYLWVDRLCIRHNNNHEFHRELKNMASLYRAAQLTIVALHGESADDGLPGVSTVRRDVQPCLELGSCRLISTMGSLESARNRSKYITRAWTYQEEVSSRRRLYFTHQQLYFKCMTSSTCETIAAHSSLERLFVEPNATYFGGAKPELGELNTAWEHISQVSGRSLTYESDRLNAVLGLLEEPPLFEGASRVRQVFGMPIPPGRRWRDDMLSPEALFALTLLWTRRHTDSRQPCFPSWSWVGWSGSKVTPHFPGQRSSDLSWSNDVEISLQSCERGELVRLDDLSRFADATIDEMPRVLRVRSRGCRLRNLIFNPSSTHRVRANFVCGLTERSVPIDTELCSDDALRRLESCSQVLALDLVDRSKGHDLDHSAPLLVVAAAAPRYGNIKLFERVGTIRLSALLSLIYLDRLRVDHFLSKWETVTVQIG
ncbi:hypothetical protein AYL99_07275 [Fonsecaea erecta]|uniref:Heterokaryon incompatibility domain-containing protein n=1 Tax=Fonsecaea erecta TaxID=1367422 RepID=A0A178ZGL6_9EURO|nr:hypothetical protein AYL99_07275 [Fonsecaea erecta]OAP58185.1 hypothetical protein AYL99_07275 [Fonsecaea erecta]